MRLTLAVPELLALDHAALTDMPALSTLAAFAGAPIVLAGGLDAALVRTDAAAETSGTAPLAALGAGFDPGAAHVLRADPVALAAGRSDVTLAGRIEDLTAAEATAMVSLLNDHFRDDGLVFHAPRPDAWFVTARRPSALITSPLACVRGAILPHLPTGEDAGQWQRWSSEVQMLLHEHPLNAARAARGLQPVTGVWFAGGGSLADLPRDPGTAIYAANGAAGDVARGIALHGGTRAEPVPPSLAALGFAGDTMVVLDPVPDVTTARVLIQGWIGPALLALQRGKLASLRVLADGGGIAAAWQAARPSLAARMRARYFGRTFVPPATAEERA
jgi:hypothetical protein